MRSWISRTWFLALLLVALIVGSLAGEELSFLGEHAWIRRTILFSVLFLMALPVEPRAFGAVWIRPAAPLLGIAANVVLVPVLGIGAAWALSTSGLDGGGRFPGGLLIACIIPCTLASASVWTRRASGNDLIAMAVMLVTNGLCFAIIPAWLSILPPSLLNGGGVTVEIPILQTVLELILFVVLPMALAQATRFLPGVKPFVASKRTILSVATQCGVLSMVLIGMVQTGQHEGSQSGSGQIVADRTLLDLLAMGLATVAVHVSALGAGWYGSGALGFRREDRIAVAIAGSQKTLMIGLDLAATFGFSILPMITYHAGQLILDTLFVERLVATASRSAHDPGSVSETESVPDSASPGAEAR
jgi:sodium/bile acid cotransporter 7